MTASAPSLAVRVRVRSAMTALRSGDGWSVACVSVSFLLGVVVPRFEGLLTSVQREPPLAMRLLLGLSAAFQQLALPAMRR